MHRGYWTYHKTYEDSCCCTPCCLTMVLTLPVWPLIFGVAVVKERMSVFNTRVTVSADAQEQNDGADISVEPDHGGDT